MYQQNYQNQFNASLSTNTIALKRFFSNRIFLALGISMLAYCVLSFIAFIFSIGTLVTAFSEILSNNIMNEAAFFESDLLDNLSFSGSVDIFSIISGIAFIMLHTKAKNPNEDIKGPVNILKTLSLISFILSCITLGFISFGVTGMCFLSIVIAIEDPAAIAIMAIIFIFMAAIIALCIVLTLLPYKFYKNIYTSATTPQLTEKYSTVLGILNVFSLIATIPISIGTIFTITTPAGIFGFLAIASQIVFLVLQTMFFFKYKSFVQDENAQRMYSATQYNYQPPQPVMNNYEPQPTPQQVQPTNMDAEYVYCPSCSAQVRREDSFCQNCGRKMFE